MSELKYLLKIALLLLLVPGYLYSGSEPMGQLIAYPNPFNNRSENLTIERQIKGVGFTGSVRMVIYDYNLKQVFEDFQTGSLKWNGHDHNGRRMKSGLYYIRIIETKANGSVSAATIKVLIK